jgi:hypothetical protein
MRSRRVVDEIQTSCYLLESLANNAEVATVLGSIPASSDTVESEGRKTKQCLITFIKKKKKYPPLYLKVTKIFLTICYVGFVTSCWNMYINVVLALLQFFSQKVFVEIVAPEGDPYTLFIIFFLFLCC